MKKLVLFVLVCLLLTGCVSYNQKQLEADLDSFLSKTNEPIDVRTNNTLTSYSFYLPSDMTIEDCFEENVILNYSNSQIVLNLNISNLISSVFYKDKQLLDDGFFKEEKVIYSNSGTYTNAENKELNYFIKVYEGDPYYMIHLMSDELNLYAYSLKEEVYETIRHMVIVSRSTKVEKLDIINKYSSTNVISYERKQIDLFQYTIPKTGYLSDLLKDE